MVVERRQWINWRFCYDSERTWISSRCELIFMDTLSLISIFNFSRCVYYGANIFYKCLFILSRACERPLSIVSTSIDNQSRQLFDFSHLFNVSVMLLNVLTTTRNKHSYFNFFWICVPIGPALLLRYCVVRCYCYASTRSVRNAHLSLPSVLTRASLFFLIAYSVPDVVTATNNCHSLYNTSKQWWFHLFSSFETSESVNLSLFQLPRSCVWRYSAESDCAAHVRTVL